MKTVFENKWFAFLKLGDIYYWDLWKNNEHSQEGVSFSYTSHRERIEREKRGKREKKIF